MSVRLQDKDYVSPGLRVVVPDASFPRMRPGDRWSHPWKYLRREVPHLWYADERFPLMGFLNRDEAAILHNIALQFAGKPALEIGSWLGWSTCHLALARVRLDVIDPAHADPEVRAIVDGALAHCHVADSVHIAATRSPEGVHALAVLRGQWNLFFIDGDHEGEAPVRDVRACLPYAADDCAFVFHDLASPAVAAALRVLEREGFSVMVYQTAQIMGIAWRGRVASVAHVPDPEVAWQLPHHLVGLPVSGVDFGACRDGRQSLFIDSLSAARPESHEYALPVPEDAARVRGAPYRLLREVVSRDEGAYRSVCIVSGEIIGPFKNGGIGTSMTGLAERLADAGHRVTILYTGGLWQPGVPLGKWKSRYAALGIDLVSLSIGDMKSLAGPLRAQGFVVPHLVYRYLATRHFDVVHFNDCGGEGSLCLAAKKLDLAFRDTLLLVALHSPSEWVLELNQTLPTSPLMSAYKYAERLSVKCADALWSPSRYLVDWAIRRGFELPAQTFVQQYSLPSRRLLESGDEGPSTFPQVSYGRTASPQEIVFFGRLEERKGLRLFCNAVHRLRHELAARNIGVTFLGKAETCGGMRSLDYIAHRKRTWDFPVRTITDSGQPQALEYLLSGKRLAVMPSRVDNSPCTVYEALAWGIPFIAARGGGVPELIHEDDHEKVLVECTTEALRESLLATLDSGGWIARPSEPQERTHGVWLDFHANATRYLPPREPIEEKRTPGVVAIVDARSGSGLDVTLASLESVASIRRVIVLNRDGVELPPSGPLPVFNLDLLVNDPEDIENELAAIAHDAVLMLHSGVVLRADAFAGMLAALGRVEIAGLVPAAEVVTEGSPRIVPSLGGAPSFTFLNGVTFTGGLLVRGEALAQARLGRSLAVDSAFMGLADFCVTRGTEVWPYPEPVFVCPSGWMAKPACSVPARLEAYDECSAIDRYYMLAAGYGAANTGVTHGRKLGVALALVDLGFAPVVAVAWWALRRWRRMRSRGWFALPARNPDNVMIGRVLATMIRMKRQAAPLRSARRGDGASTGSTMYVALSLAGGGAERLLANLMGHQRSPVESRCVVTLYPGGEFRSIIEDAGVEVLDLGMRSRADTPRTLFRLAALVRTRRPAVVHGWDYIANILASAALALARRPDTRLIWTILTSDLDVRDYPRRLRYYCMLARLLSPYCDGIIYNAQQARDYHESIGFRPPRSLVIRNCLDTQVFRRDPALRETVRHQLGIPDDVVVVVIAARQDPMKDWSGMLAAVCGLPGVITVAIGKDTERLPQQLGLMRLGWRDDVHRILNAGDIFMLASAFGEGTSLAVVEAMSCSLPCVVTDVGGNGMIVGDAGIVVPRRQTTAVRDALMQLVRDPERRETLGRAARARLASGYSPDDIAALLGEFARSAGDAA